MKDIILQIRKTIKQLSKDPKEADTIKALEKQILNMMDCKHGEYTNDLFNIRGCKTCGSPKVVICSHEKVIGKRRNGNLCKQNSCKYFKNLTKM